jgi:hypothetical protein
MFMPMSGSRLSAVNLPGRHDASPAEGSLAAADTTRLLKPNLVPTEVAVAQVESWVLGLAGLIR